MVSWFSLRWLKDNESTLQTKNARPLVSGLGGEQSSTGSVRKDIFRWSLVPGAVAILHFSFWHAVGLRPRLLTVEYREYDLPDLVFMSGLHFTQNQKHSESFRNCVSLPGFVAIIP